MGYKEKNPCKSRGCAGACCMDIILEDLTNDEMTVITQNATEIVEVPDVLESAHRTRVKAGRSKRDPDNLPQTTVYISRKLDKNAVLLDGPCPNLKENGECGVYANRPQICKDFKVGEKETCQIVRMTSPLGGSVFIGNIQMRPAN